MGKLRAIWHVLLGRPLVYKMILTDPLGFPQDLKHVLIESCIFQFQLTTDCDYTPQDLTVLTVKNEKGQIKEIKASQLSYTATENLSVLKVI